MIFSHQGVYFVGAAGYGEMVGRHFALTFEIVDVSVAGKRIGDRRRGSSEGQAGTKPYQVSGQAERATSEPRFVLVVLEFWCRPKQNRAHATGGLLSIGRLSIDRCVALAGVAVCFRCDEA